VVVQLAFHIDYLNWVDKIDQENAECPFCRDLLSKVAPENHFLNMIEL